MQKSWNITETLANGYSSESTHQELSKEYQHDGLNSFQKSLCSCALDESSLSIGRVKLHVSCHSYVYIVCCAALNGFQKSLRSCSLDESSLSIGRVKHVSCHSYVCMVCCAAWCEISTASMSTCAWGSTLAACTAECWAYASGSLMSGPMTSPSPTAWKQEVYLGRCRTGISCRVDFLYRLKVFLVMCP